MTVVAKAIGAAVAALAATTLSLLAAAPAHADPQDCADYLNGAGFSGDYVATACDQALTDPEAAIATLRDHAVPTHQAAMAVTLAEE